LSNSFFFPSFHFCRGLAFCFSGWRCLGFSCCFRCRGVEVVIVDVAPRSGGGQRQQKLAQHHRSSTTPIMPYVIEELTTYQFKTLKTPAQPPWVSSQCSLAKYSVQSRLITLKETKKKTSRSLPL